MLLPIKSNLKFLGVVLIALIGVGCAPTKNVIPPLHYKKLLDIKVNKTAYLYWVPGRQVACEKPTNNYHSSNANNDGGVGGLVATMIFSAIENQHRKNHPSEYHYIYGKADEAVFMTSLRDILNQQQVFKNTELITDLRNAKARDVVIELYFKTARVVHAGDIKLSVVLSIKEGKRLLYERTYLTVNDPPETSKAKQFVEKKTEVSQKMLTMILEGIKQWVEEKKA